MENTYNAAHHYTLHDLISCHVLDSPDILSVVCNKAEKEAQLQVSVARLQEGWEGRTISIDQSLLNWCMFAVLETEHNEMTESKEETNHLTSCTMFPRVSSTPFLTVSNADELCMLVEEDLVQLQVLLGSPHLGMLKGQAVHWQSVLRHLQEILSLISVCQEKVSSCTVLYMCMHLCMFESIILHLLYMCILMSVVYIECCIQI